jgi:hypothetical protein
LRYGVRHHAGLNKLRPCPKHRDDLFQSMRFKI